MKLKNLIPMLNVSDIEESLKFYQTALGFEVVSDTNAVKEWKWATIRSGGTELMLSETESPPNFEKGIDPHQDISWPTIFYYYPESVDQLHAHVLAHGYKPTEIINTIYGMKEFSIQDPDGHMLSFGEDVNE